MPAPSPASRSRAPVSSSGPRRTARVLAAATALLLMVGGLVTTYRVGMAVHDWPTTFGYSMFSYPLDRMLEDFGVTVEHGHRLLASVVGLLTIALVVCGSLRAGRAAGALTALAVVAEVGLAVAVVLDGGVGGPLQGALLAGLVSALAAACLVGPDRGRRALFAAIHLAVIGQGWLGGSRVLENSQQLAFLHGSAAQLVFALIAAGVVVTASNWPAARPHPLESARGLAPSAAATSALVFGQIVLGAWLRHSGRGLPLVLHVALALVAVGAVLLLARRLRVVAERGADRGLELGALAAVRRWLLVSLWAQVLLGVLALAAILFLGGGFQGVVTVAEAVSATLHVVVGASLLASCTAAGLWAARLTAPAGGATRAVVRLQGGAA